MPVSERIGDEVIILIHAAHFGQEDTGKAKTEINKLVEAALKDLKAQYGKEKIYISAKEDINKKGYEEYIESRREGKDAVLEDTVNKGPEQPLSERLRKIQAKSLKHLFENKGRSEERRVGKECR